MVQWKTVDNLSGRCLLCNEVGTLRGACASCGGPVKKPEHFEILDHTINRASKGLFCGDSPAMQELVEAGLMESAGRAGWCPDEFFRITPAGREAHRQSGAGE